MGIEWKLLDNNKHDLNPPVSSDTEDFSVDIPENTGTNPVTYYVTYNNTDTGCYAEKTITVPTGSTCNCPCVCNDLSFSITSIEIGSENGSTASTTYTFNCNKGVDVISVVEKPSWLNNPTFNNGTLTFTTNETSTAERSGSVKFKVCDDTCDTNTITIIQKSPSCDRHFAATFTGTYTETGCTLGSTVYYACTDLIIKITSSDIVTENVNLSISLKSNCPECLEETGTWEKGEKTVNIVYTPSDGTSKEIQLGITDFGHLTICGGMVNCQITGFSASGENCNYTTEYDDNILLPYAHD